MVRFADAMGLDLEKVRHFLQDQLPTTPVALDDAPIASIPNEKDRFAKAKYITAMFPQPCLATSFLDRIRSQKVSLDSVQTTDFVVTGIVRVLNIAFKKSVYVRYTFDKWKTTLDTLAQYIPKSSDGFSDKFQFVLHAPAYFDVGQTMEFAICFKGDDTDYWDNNYGQNYSLWCCAGTEVPGGGYSISPSNSSNAFLWWGYAEQGYFWLIYCLRRKSQNLSFLNIWRRKMSENYWPFQHLFFDGLFGSLGCFFGILELIFSPNCDNQFELAVCRH